MYQAALYGVLAVALYGLFLFIRGLVRLKRYGEKKMMAWSLGLYLAVGALFALSLTIKYEDLNIWIALPALGLGLLWLCLGFFLESYVRKERLRLEAGQPRQRPQAPTHWLRDNLLILAAALLIWAYGAFIGNFGGNQAVETLLICLCLFFLTSSCSKLWKHRSF